MKLLFLQPSRNPLGLKTEFSSDKFEFLILHLILTLKFHSKMLKSIVLVLTRVITILGALTADFQS